MDKYNSDELEAPEWLNKSFIEDVLKHSEEDDKIKVTDFNVSPATKKGDHFASIMFRVEVEYLISNNPKQISLILKTMPVIDGAKKELVDSTYAFETEISMYSEIIPKFHKMLREIGDDTVLGARMIYSSLEPIKIIIFEDLAKQGYQMVPNKCLEPHEIDAMLKKICRWHAISFKLIKDGDASIKRFKEGVFNIQQKSMDDFFNGGIKGFSNFLANHGIDPIYLKKFTEIRDSLVQKCKDIYKLQGDLCVLNHGDFHINNTMVKIGQDGTIDDLMLVDFQFCIAAPLAIDLTYLFSAILNPDCREHRDEIIYKYHTLFIEILCKLGYDGKMPTLLDIHMELMLYKEMDVLMLVAFLPFMCALKEKAEIDDKLMEDPEMILKFYDVPGYINLAKRILPELLMIYSSLDPIKIIIFEDLKIQGYQVLPNKYLEPDEVDALLEKICRWHAISFKLLKEGDKSIQDFRNSGFDLEEVKSFFHRSINDFLKLLYDQNFDPIYTDKFEKIKEVIVQECRDIYNFRGDLCVLNHGDFTLKNIMVKIGQKDTIDDLMLVDFQFCIAAPLVSDLKYLLYAILNPHSRDQHDKIIYKYHTLFVEILQKLEYRGKIPTLIDIRTERLRYKALEVALIMVFMPFMCAVKDNIEMDDRLMEDPNFFLSFYERPAYISTIQKILPELLHKGYLD